MLKQASNRIKTIRAGLINLNNQPIGKAVLTIVLFLDLFILISIFQGLSDHTRQLSTAYESIPQHCRDIVIDQGWNEDNRLVKTATIVTRSRNSYRYINKKDWIKDVHPICVPIISILRKIEKNKTLTTDLNEFLRNRTHADEVKVGIERSRSAYDTSLLEIIANEKDGIENRESLKRQVSALTQKLNTLVSQEAYAISVFTNNAQIDQLFRIIEASPQNRDVLLEELRHLNFWYPVKRLGMELLFLLPLIIIFFLWNSKSITASRPYQSLVSSHLLVVVFIPVIFKFIELVYDIMPKKILKYVIELFESLNLVAVWHYLMMFGGILGAMALIYVMQKKIFSPEKLMQKRIAKSLCQNCGVHLPSEKHACCSICGFKQYRACSHCTKETYVNGKFCRECGCEE